jgi:hypothetical protein
MLTTGMFIQGVPKMLKQTQERFPPPSPQRTHKNYYSNICSQTPSFGGAAHHRAELSLLYFCLWGSLEN